MLSYKKLWKLLVDKKMNKTELKKCTKLSSATIAKLSNGENVNTNVLVRICKVLDCELNEIVEIEKEVD